MAVEMYALRGAWVKMTANLRGRGSAWFQAKPNPFYKYKWIILVLRARDV